MKGINSMSSSVFTLLESFRRLPIQDTPLPAMYLALLERLDREKPSPEMYSALLERVEREDKITREEAQKQAHARAWELARQQGVEPIRDIKELQGDFWPEDESVDEFLEWVRAIRQDKIGA
jgi:hypothetical protein